MVEFFSALTTPFIIIQMLVRKCAHFNNNDDFCLLNQNNCSSKRKEKKFNNLPCLHIFT